MRSLPGYFPPVNTSNKPYPIPKHVSKRKRSRSTSADPTTTAASLRLKDPPGAVSKSLPAQTATQASHINWTARKKRRLDANPKSTKTVTPSPPVVRNPGRETPLDQDDDNPEADSIDYGNFRALREFPEADTNDGDDWNDWFGTPTAKATPPLPKQPQFETPFAAAQSSQPSISNGNCSRSLNKSVGGQVDPTTNDKFLAHELNKAWNQRWQMLVKAMTTIMTVTTTTMTATGMILIATWESLTWYHST